MCAFKYVVTAADSKYIRTDKETWFAIKSYAKSEGITLSAAVRVLVRMALAYLVAMKEKEEIIRVKKIVDLHKQVYGDLSAITEAGGRR